MNSGKLKLLIVDDEASTRKVLEHFLNKEFDVTVKNDGMEGMNWLDAGNDTNFIIADLNMPNLDGYRPNKADVCGGGPNTDAIDPWNNHEGGACRIPYGHV